MCCKIRVIIFFVEVLYRVFLYFIMPKNTQKHNNKPKKYRGGSCTIKCDDIKHDNLKKLCVELGGVTNLIEPFLLDKKNERNYTDEELNLMNSEYKIVKQNCVSNTEVNSNANNANINNTKSDNKLCTDGVITISDNTDYTTLNSTLTNNNCNITVQYNMKYKDDTNLKNLMNNNKNKKNITFKEITQGGTRRRKSNKNKRTNKKRNQRKI